MKKCPASSQGPGPRLTTYVVALPSAASPACRRHRELLTCPLCHIDKRWQRPLNHLIRCRQAYSKVVGRIHHATGQDKNITICKRGPLSLRIAIRPLAPKVECAFRRKD